MHIHTCIHRYTYTYALVQIYTHMHTHVCIHIHIYIPMYMYTYSIHIHAYTKEFFFFYVYVILLLYISSNTLYEKLRSPISSLTAWEVLQSHEAHQILNSLVAIIPTLFIHDLLSSLCHAPFPRWTSKFSFYALPPLAGIHSISTEDLCMFPLKSSGSPSSSGRGYPGRARRRPGLSDPWRWLEFWPDHISLHDASVSRAVCDLVLLQVKWDSWHLPTAPLTGTLDRAVQ